MLTRSLFLSASQSSFLAVVYVILFVWKFLFSSKNFHFSCNVLAFLWNHFSRLFIERFSSCFCRCFSFDFPFDTGKEQYTQQQTPNIFNDRKRRLKTHLFSFSLAPSPSFASDNPEPKKGKKEFKMFFSCFVGWSKIENSSQSFRSIF